MCLIIKYLVATYYVHAKTKDKDLFVLFLLRRAYPLCSESRSRLGISRRAVGMRIT